MSLLRSIGRFLRDTFAPEPPKTLLQLANEQRRQKKGKLANLYVVEVDFSVGEDHPLLKSLAEIRDKYGIDFLPTEPGIKIKRFIDL